MDAHTDAESIAADSWAALVERVNRQSATVGAKTPETITVNGTEATLHAFLIEPRNLPDFCWVPRDSSRQRKHRLTTEHDARVERLKTNKSPSQATA